MSKQAGHTPSIHFGTASTPSSVAVVRYTDAFKRQLKRLSRRYRHIRQDVQPFLERARIDALLAASEADEDAIRRLADEVDAGWWAANRDRFLAGTSATERPE